MKNTVISLSILLIIIFSACQNIEKKTLTSGEAQTLLTEAVTAFSIYSKTQEDATKAAFESENTLKSAETNTDEYPVITIDPFNLTEWPKTITIDYGPENHLGIDGRYRRGVMLIKAHNFAEIENTVWEITFSDYYQNDHKVEGTQTIKYTGLNTSNNPEYECSIIDGVITTPAGKLFYFEQDTKREWIYGHDTHYVTTGNIEDLCDDEYLISGTHSGVSSDGYTYTMSALNDPLHVNVCCKYVMEGILSVSLPDNNLSCEIDYRPDSDVGDMCNSEAAFTIFGITYPITLN
ncbi:hypothetical protein OU798_13010 [Prolixibacteraceae bacterium Z1-6]|uniref:Lipoprotein n=1 Tax=Draconibacterium aestuarii TaxID=2998507 RepID=A0A9X3F9H8_9BACT|nr:hypothetical protein [Prolixibacteraceae bacterium Z1-6]